ncbi:LysR family transcriptional regulator [Opitutaceae bacterium TAV4]|nr:LysR family transcriptional regulator [Opitutaceae bacterium TAV4]RRJ99942.1 LysR family transcriptional regulator [Opitutaceae bacterium TAV3]
MELRHLRYFTAVARELSFRRAAEGLRVAQPALSKQIKDLEHEVGVELLDRDTTGVRLTEAGAVFLAEVGPVLARVAQAVEFAREARLGRRGRLTIGNVGPMSTSFMPASLVAFRERFPDVDVMLREMRSLDQIRALETGEIQVGFAGTMGEAKPAGDLEMMRVLSSPLRFVMARGHPLASAASVSFAQLEGERLLAVADPKRAGPDHAEAMRALFAAQGCRPGAMQLVDSLESLLAMVAGQQGISMMPRIISTHHAEGIVSKSVRGAGAEMEFHLWAVWRGDASPVARNFIGVLREVQGETKKAKKLKG